MPKDPIPLPERNGPSPDERFDRAEVEAQTIRAGAYYAKMFKRFEGKAVIVAEVDGVVLIAGTGPWARALRQYAEDMGLKVNTPPAK